MEIECCEDGLNPDMNLCSPEDFDASVVVHLEKQCLEALETISRLERKAIGDEVEAPVVELGSAELLVKIARRACQSLELLSELAPDVIDEVAGKKSEWPVLARIRHRKETKKRSAFNEFVVTTKPDIALGAKLPVRFDKKLNWVKGRIVDYVERAIAIQEGPKPVKRSLVDMTEDEERNLPEKTFIELAEQEYNEQMTAYQLPPLTNEKVARAAWTEAIVNDLGQDMLVSSETLVSGADKRFIWFNEEPFRSRTSSRILARKMELRKEAKAELETALTEEGKRQEENMFRDNYTKKIEQYDAGVRSENVEEWTVREVVSENLKALLRK